MNRLLFRERLLAEIERQRISVAALTRRAGVKYDVVRDLKRRPDASTSIENARKLSEALGFSLDGLDDPPEAAEVDELVTRFRKVAPADRRHVLALLRSMEDAELGEDTPGPHPGANGSR